MTPRGRAVILLITGVIAALIAAYCWFVPDTAWWRVAGTILVAIAAASWFTGGRLFRKAEQRQPEETNSTADSEPDGA